MGNCDKVYEIYYMPNFVDKDCLTIFLGTTRRSDLVRAVGPLERHRGVSSEAESSVFAISSANKLPRLWLVLVACWFLRGSVTRQRDCYQLHLLLDAWQLLSKSATIEMTPSFPEYVFLSRIPSPWTIDKSRPLFQ